MFTTCANCFIFFATSAIRSVPLAWFGEVIATSAPQSNAASAIRKSSVAMTSLSSFFARRQRSQTCRNSGFPAIACSALPGKRVDPQRAGIMPTALVILLENNFRGVSDVARDPIGAAIVFAGSVTGLDEDRANPGVLSATDVAGLVPNEKRSSQIQMVLALRLENHAGAGFSPNRRRCRQVGTMIAGVNQIVSELPAKFCFDSAVIILGEIAAPDSALVGNDHQRVTFFLEPAQCFGRLGIHFDFAGIATIIHIAHQSAVAIEENSGPALVRRAGHFRNSRSVPPA